MNKIVRDHYPASRLPDDLRDGLRGAISVRLTIEPSQPVAGSLSSAIERAQRLRASGAIRTVTAEEAVARVRALRDEWDS